MWMRILYLKLTAPCLPLVEACLALTPHLAHLYPDLFLDITSTEKRLGGELRVLWLLHSIVRSFSEDLIERVALVDRPEWARALAWPLRETILPRGESRDRLFTLPLARLLEVGDPLTLEAQTPEREKMLDWLRRVGLVMVGDFAKLPPSTVGHRFGQLGVRLHEAVWGRMVLKLPLFSPDGPVEERLDGEEIVNQESLLFWLRQVFLRLEARMVGRGQAVQSLRFQFELESSPTLTKTLTLSEPCREAGKLLRLARDFLENLRWDSPLVRLTLTVVSSCPFVPGQLALFEDSEQRLSELSHYWNRLEVRWGEGRAGFAQLKESYLPERAWVLGFPPKRVLGGRFPYPHRPLFFYDPPRPWRPSRSTRLLLLEKVQGEWWQGQKPREYFLAEQGKEQLWVFRREGEWFLQGKFHD